MGTGRENAKHPEPVPLPIREEHAAKQIIAAIREWRKAGKPRKR